MLTTAGPIFFASGAKSLKLVASSLRSEASLIPEAAKVMVRTNTVGKNLFRPTRWIKVFGILNGSIVVNDSFLAA
jgi:hypothetical protein